MASQLAGKACFNPFFDYLVPVGCRVVDVMVPSFDFYLKALHAFGSLFFQPHPYPLLHAPNRITISIYFYYLKRMQGN
jgi:hypothetical protein